MPRAGVYGRLLVGAILALGVSATLSSADEAPAPTSKNPGNEGLEAKLARRIDLDIRAVPLRKLILDLAEEHGFEVQFDEAGIAAQSIPLDRPVSLAMRRITIKAALTRLLRKYGVQPYLEEEKGVVVIGCMAPQLLAPRPLPAPRAPRIAIAVVEEGGAADQRAMRLRLQRPPVRAGNLRIEPDDNFPEDGAEIAVFSVPNDVPKTEAQRRQSARGAFFAMIQCASIEKLQAHHRSVLQARIDHDHLYCSLSDQQRQKLRLAGQGDIQRRIDHIERQCVEFTKLYRAEDDSVEVTPEQYRAIEGLIQEIQAEMSGADSLYARMREQQLTAPQKATLNAVARLKGAGVHVVTSRDGAPGVREIHFSVRSAPSDFLELLPRFPQLECLSLDTTRITDDQLKYLADLKELKSLELSRTKIGDDGLLHLRNLTRLESLSLAQSDVTDVGLDHLKPLTRLKTLDLTATDVTDAGVARLQEQFPGLKVSR